MTRARARQLAARTIVTTRRSVLEFVEDRGHRSAAQISFFAILSFIPLVLLLAAAFGLVFDDSAVQDRIVNTVFDNVPLASAGDRPKLERSVGDALTHAGRLGIFSTLLLLAAASGVMGALRHSINQAWDIEARPPLLQRKAIDLALVSGGTLVLLLSLSLSATRWLADLADGVSPALALALRAVEGVLPFLLAAGVILFLYRVLPLERPHTRDIWPGAVVAALLLGAVRVGLEAYFGHLADFGALYGSLGAFMALLLFVYAAAIVLVFGAEFASEWARLPGDDAEVHRIVRSGAARARRWARRSRDRARPARR